jgi:signal peptidase II
VTETAVASEERPAALRGRLLAFALALLIAVVDLWSKEAVFASLATGEQRPVFAGQDWLKLTAVHNPGVMWGALPEAAAFLPWLRAAAAVVVIVMLFSTHPRARTTLVALGLVLGGAVGNVYDGFKLGKVRDFVLVDLDIPVFDPFPVFNVADSAICVGVALLALGMLFERPRSA